MAYLPPDAPPPVAQNATPSGVRAAQINLILALVPVIWWLGVILGYALLDKEIYVPEPLTTLWGFLILPAAVCAVTAVIRGHVAFKKSIVPDSQKAKTIFSIVLGYIAFAPMLLLFLGLLAFVAS
jgi:hypothetical protein